jgi:hypothetical protein
VVKIHDRRAPLEVDLAQKGDPPGQESAVALGEARVAQGSRRGTPVLGPHQEVHVARGAAGRRAQEVELLERALEVQRPQASRRQEPLDLARERERGEVDGGDAQAEGGDLGPEGRAARGRSSPRVEVGDGLVAAREVQKERRVRARGRGRGTRSPDGGQRGQQRARFPIERTWLWGLLLRISAEKGIARSQVRRFHNLQLSRAAPTRPVI